MTNFGVIDGKETVRYVLNLLESLSATTSLKEIFVIDVEVAFLGIFDFVADSELAVEESFTLVAFVNTRTEDVHQVGIA